MTRLVQLIDESGARRVAVSSTDANTLQLINGYTSVYDLARAAIRAGEPLAALVLSCLSDVRLNYDRALAECRLLAPLDHPDPARCVVSLTGLTHLGSATSRDRMHAAIAAGEATDSMRMFQLGVEGGKPTGGQIGAQPEWAYKGDGRCVVAPEHALTQPSFALDGGEEAEIAGLYVIADDGTPWRVGFALGNEFADHVMEKQNYLCLAHSKLRACSIGPELLTGELPDRVDGSIRIRRGAEIVWRSQFASGEANMCHAIVNLEHHHFKYDLFRRPGDVHIHFFGANGVSFGEGFRAQAGDVFEIDVPLFGRPLRNPLSIESEQERSAVRVL